MKNFEYVIKDELGIHARPAGALAKTAKEFESKVVICKGEKKVEATKLMGLMSMGIKQGDAVVVEVEGADEDAALTAVQAFFTENL